MRRLVAAIGAVIALAVPAAAAAAPPGFGFLTTWGTQGTGDGQFELPDGIDVDNAGTVWVADRDRNRIERFDSNGHFKPFAPFRSRHRSSAPGRFNLPYDVATDPVGDIYVADTHNHRIQEFDPQGKLIRRWGSHGTGPGQFDQPRGVALDPQGNVWVADHENRRVQKFTSDGRFLGAFGGFNSPRGLSVDRQGFVYVADDVNARIVKLDSNGNVVATWGSFGSGDGQLSLPYATAIAPDGNVWVADTNNSRVVEFTPDGQFVSRIGANGGDGSAGTGPGEFNRVYNVAFDCAGNLYVTDQMNDRVEKFGVPGAGRPVCPPNVTMGAARGTGKTLTVTATCDRMCALSATATVRVGGRRVTLRSPARRLIAPAGAETAVPLRARVAVHGKLTITVTASGAPGAERRVKRTVTLR